jgi:hypothetical protein
MQILPFVEGNNLATLRQNHGFALAPTPNGDFCSDYSVPNLACPSRGIRNWSTANGHNWFCADYANPMGAFPDPADRSPERQSPAPGFAEQSMYVGLIVPAGRMRFLGGANYEILQKFSKVGFGSINDGSSNTFMLMEKSADAMRYSGVGQTGLRIVGEVGGLVDPNWYTNGRWIKPFSIDGGPFVMDGEVRPALGNNRALDERYFGGPHPGTLSVAMGDGSTHSVSADASWNAIFDLMGRNDGFISNITEQ